jgi:hypothetical protein
MLNQLLFIIFGIGLDRSNFIKLPDPKYEPIHIMNYWTWSSIALYSLFYHTTYLQSYIFITNIAMCSYLYEIIFHTPDKYHLFNHVCTIIIMRIGYASGMYVYSWGQYLSLIYYVAVSFIILSSVRHLEILVPYKYKKPGLYKSYYIFSKSMAIVFHYWILIENWRSSLTLFENVTAVIFFIIHLILYINKDHNL